MDADAVILDLATAGTADRASVGGKAGVLGELATAGFPVLPGVVVTAAALDDPDGLDVMLADAARRLGVGRFAVRSSGAAEDLPDASYAGLYETYLNVTADGLGQAVRRCFAAATAERVSAYHQRHAAARPGWRSWCNRCSTRWRPGWRSPPIRSPATGTRRWSPPWPVWVTHWCPAKRSVRSGRSPPRRHRDPSDAAASRVLTAGQAQAVADLARRVADRYGRPQDIEWAVDRDGRLWLLQARPMTAVPDPVSWAPPGPGLWMRNFRLGEWLPEAVTPLFATWLLPVLEDGFLDGMHASVGVRVPFRYALVNGWYYIATQSRHRCCWPGCCGRARPGGEDPLQRVDPGQPRPGGRRPRRAVRSGPAMARASSARLPAAGRRRRDRGRNGGPGPVGAAGRPARPRGRDPAVVSGDRGRVGVEDGSLPDPVLPPAPGPRAARRRRRGASAAARTARRPTGEYAARGAKRRLVPPGRRRTAHRSHRAAGRKPAACPADRATRQRRGCVPGGPRR